MGTFLVFVVFGLPIVFIFWIACSSIVGGNLLGGFFTAILLFFIISFVAIFVGKNKSSSDVILKIAEDNNKNFRKNVESSHGRYFLIETDQKELLFDVNKYNNLSGCVTLHYTHGRTDVVFDFKDIRSCILHKATKIIRKCSVFDVSSVKTKTFSTKYVLEIQSGEKYMAIQSDDIDILTQIYDTTEYIITKGKSMETSPFSI